MAIGDVLDAYREVSILQEDFGSIKWPVALHDDACDEYGYQNAAVMQALNEAMYSIIQIVSNPAARPHPILAYYQDWLQQHSPKSLEASFQNDCFTYNLLPGDWSLSADATAALSGSLAGSLLGFDVGEALAVLPVIQVLCDLVVVRVYLGRPTSDDSQIYHLARNYSKKELESLEPNSPQDGFLQRHLSIPEGALAASQGSLDTQVLPVYTNLTGLKGITSSRHEISLENIPLFSDGTQAITAHYKNGSPYMWNSHSQIDYFTLAGGEPFPMSTPLAKVVHLPPTTPPGPPVKNKNVHLDPDSSPTHGYSLRQNPSSTTRYEKVHTLRKRSHEEDSEDDWEKPGYVKKLKHEQRKNDVKEEDLTKIMDLLESKKVPQTKLKTSRGRGHGQRSRLAGRKAVHK
ncbi:hypothetical protein GYMLUDRAFT_253125 [Collybiopsis luxurians FD-317 M1]|uniref:Uncharacterized protein n=1 Tax=Collybiopsis luxurians FD-317 M1 TaxID=944289 RepID=A0A0D0C6C4_9AGAR|nr:hypothetical protein GYMLUDRAFT_253125 [Collybiopsis luxurians FD-317 M1]